MCWIERIAFDRIYKHCPNTNLIEPKMYTVTITISVPLEEHKIETITAALKKIDKDTIITARNEDTGQISYKCPEADDTNYEALSELYETWFEEPNPLIIGYAAPALE